jgi:hypothetical protein
LAVNVSEAVAADLLDKASRLSIYKYHSPLSPGYLPFVRTHPVLYRNHIYYCKD